MPSFGAVMAPISTQQSQVTAKAQICQKCEVKNFPYRTLSFFYLLASLYKTYLENLRQHVH